jgi:cytochrome c-type biogenesis protein CcmF
MYWLQQQPASIPSVYSTLREDVYVTLTALEPDGSATLKIYRNPLVNWIWIGGGMFLVGMVAVMWPHPQRRAESQDG